MSKRILVVYATTHGHTEKIAGRIAEAMRAEGADVELTELAGAGVPGPQRCDMVVVAASVHAGHHQHELVDWAKANRRALAEQRSAFISVSLQAAEDSDEARDATQEHIDRFVEDTGWQPSHSVAVAGALQYQEYDLFTRLLMRLLMRRGGHPTDTSHDYDYTDWDALDRLGRELAEMADRKHAAAGT